MNRQLIALLIVVCAATDAYGAAKETSREPSDYFFAESGSQPVLVSARSGVRFKANAGQDTFYLYGGPGTYEGKFQTGPGAPDELGHFPHDIRPGKWMGIDLTEQFSFWQISDFCAETLDGDNSSGGAGDGPENLAWWCGQTAEQQPTWATAPGYGNLWNTSLEWRTTVANPGSTGQTVGLSFAFHHDTEPAYDFFSVEYDSAETFNSIYSVKTVYSVDGSNAPFDAPGVQYPSGVVTELIVYAPGSYVGPNQDEIILYLTVSSDGAWSDKDGLWPTTCGAAIVDDITVTYDDGTGQIVVDFSDVDTTNSWGPRRFPFIGDFAAIHPLFSDIDACRENSTPAVGFLDDGRCPPNLGNNAGEPPCESTGGSTSATWSYGAPGGWVTNYTDGLSGGSLSMFNELWSPPIAWDLPGSADDAVDVAGAGIRFSVWQHLPLDNGIFYIWKMRASDDGLVWSPEHHSFLYHGNEPRWVNEQHIVTDLVLGPFGGQAPGFARIELGVVDLADLFGLPGNDATPAPLFDNVAMFKFRLEGPTFRTRSIDLFMDAFPASGASSFDTPAERQAAGCRIDMRDISSGALNFPGDSTIVDVVSAIPGRDLLGPPQLHWVLDKNPLFDDVRGAAPEFGAKLVPGGAANGWDQWTGTVVGEQVLVGLGVPIADRYQADLFDGQPRSIGGTTTPDFAYPGDVLRYYWRAEDTGGGVSTLPTHIDGFATGLSSNGKLYAPEFTVRLLPSVRDDGQGSVEQPEILVVNDGGFDQADEHYQAFAQNGWVLGHDWDQYTVFGPSSLVSNGIGSAYTHGATAEQLDGYRVIVYDAADQSVGLLSDGTDDTINDKGDDLGVLTAWFGRAGNRYLAHFGDDIVSAVLDGSPGAGGLYVQDVMGIDLVGDHVAGAIDAQTAPLVKPAVGSPWFSTSFVAYGGCTPLNDFDDLSPRPGAVRTHEFCDANGSPYGGPGRAASISYERFDGQDRKVSLVFPYGFSTVWDVTPGDGDPLSVRANLLREILDGCFANAPIGGTPTAVPVGFRGVRNVSSFPNPFNPTVTIRFELGRRSRTTVQAFNLRGERVATVFSGALDAGVQEVVWAGRDDRGEPLASGVYFLRAEADADRHVERVTLLK